MAESKFLVTAVVTLVHPDGQRVPASRAEQLIKSKLEEETGAQEWSTPLITRATMTRVRRAPEY